MNSYVKMLDLANMDTKSWTNWVQTTMMNGVLNENDVWLIRIQYYYGYEWRKRQVYCVQTVSRNNANIIENI